MRSVTPSGVLGFFIKQIRNDVLFLHGQDYRRKKKSSSKKSHNITKLKIRRVKKVEGKSLEVNCNDKVLCRITKFSLSNTRITSVRYIGNGFFIYLEGENPKKVSVGKPFDEAGKIKMSRIKPFLEKGEDYSVKEIREISSSLYAIIYCSKQFERYFYELWSIKFQKRKGILEPMITNKLSKRYGGFFIPTFCKYNSRTLFVKIGFNIRIFSSKVTKKVRKSGTSIHHVKWTDKGEIFIKPSLKNRNINPFQPIGDFLNPKLGSYRTHPLIPVAERNSIVYFCQQTIGEIIVSKKIQTNRDCGKIGSVVNLEDDSIVSVHRIDRNTITVKCRNSTKSFDPINFKWIELDQATHGITEEEKKKKKKNCRIEELRERAFDVKNKKKEDDDDDDYENFFSVSGEEGVVENWKVVVSPRVKMDWKKDEKERRDFVVVVVVPRVRITGGNMSLLIPKSFCV